MLKHVFFHSIRKNETENAIKSEKSEYQDKNILQFVRLYFNRRFQVAQCAHAEINRYLGLHQSLPC